MRSPVGSFSASACHFVHWNNTGSGAPALDLEGGASIVQGCTFGNMGPHVRVGPKVRSAIIMGNQASGGIIVKNSAGKRTQMVANEENPVDWTPEARLHYRILIGQDGDARHVDGVHGPERLIVGGKERTHRWTVGYGRLTLPIRPRRSYTMTLDLSIPEAALSPEAGVYLGEKRLAAFTKAGSTSITVQIPPQTGDTVELTIRAKGWIPSKVIKGSADNRILGVQLYSVTMRARAASDRVFDGNTGRFVQAGGTER